MTNEELADTLISSYLAGCQKVSGRDRDRRVRLSPVETISDDGFGDYTPGRWVWKLDDVRPLAEPPPVKGAQGWWKWIVPKEAMSHV